MCLRIIRIIRNIENVTVDELLAFMQRRLQIYGLIFIVVAVKFFLSNDYHTTFLTMNMITLALYFISMLVIKQLRVRPTARNAIYPFIAGTTVLTFNIFKLLYSLILAKNYWALFRIFIVVLQVSTLFIIYKLREKLKDMDQTCAEYADLEAPPSQVSDVPARSEPEQGTCSKDTIDNPMLPRME